VTGGGGNGRSSFSTHGTDLTLILALVKGRAGGAGRLPTGVFGGVAVVDKGTPTGSLINRAPALSAGSSPLLASVAASGDSDREGT